MTMNEPGFVIRLALALAGDAVFGVMFNRWVAWHQARNEGVYTAFYVTGGVLVTLASAALVIGVSEALVMLALRSGGMSVRLDDLPSDDEVEDALAV